MLLITATNPAPGSLKVLDESPKSASANSSNIFLICFVRLVVTSAAASIAACFALSSAPSTPATTAALARSMCFENVVSGHGSQALYPRRFGHGAISHASHNLRASSRRLSHASPSENGASRSRSKCLKPPSSSYSFFNAAPLRLSSSDSTPAECSFICFYMRSVMDMLDPSVLSTLFH